MTGYGLRLWFKDSCLPRHVPPGICQSHRVEKWRNGSFTYCQKCVCWTITKCYERGKMQRTQRQWEPKTWQSQLGFQWQRLERGLSLTEFSLVSSALIAPTFDWPIYDLFWLTEWKWKNIFIMDIVIIIYIRQSTFLITLGSVLTTVSWKNFEPKLLTYKFL